MIKRKKSFVRIKLKNDKKKKKFFVRIKLKNDKKKKKFFVGIPSEIKHLAIEHLISNRTPTILIWGTNN